MSKQQTLLMLMILIIAGNGVAIGSVIGFSADAVQVSPMKKEYQAKMYVSNDAVRTESRINGVSVAEIVSTKLNSRILLIEKEKKYVQQNSNARLQNMLANKTTPMVPCAGLKNTTCQKLSTVKINNRKTEKWQFTLKKNGQIFNSLHWIDEEYRMPVREFFHNGTVMELTMQGAETLYGRATVKWLMLITYTDGREISATQWYDPELNMITREEMAGGYVRELRNIKIGKQDKSLFELPDGYTKTEKLPAYLMPRNGAAPPMSNAR